MTDPISTSALLLAVGPALAEGAAKGAGSAAGSAGIKGWLARSAHERAAKRAVRAAADRHAFPGAARALDTWRASPAFENMLLAATLGRTERLAPERVAQSFLDAASPGWGEAAFQRALALSNTFLSALFAEIADGPGGNAFRARLDEARHAEAGSERATLQDGVDRIEEGVEGVGRDVRGVDEKLNRLLARDASLPASVRDAVAQGVFDDLTERLAAGDAEGALDLALRCDVSVSKALDAADETDGALADALRPYRQRVRFAAATAASLLGRNGDAKAHARSALALGGVEPQWYRQAATALFNARLTEPLRALVAQMETDSDAHQEAAPLLTYLDGDWSAVQTAFATRTGADAAFMTVQARIETLDPSDPTAVADATAQLDEVVDEALLSSRIQGARLTVRLLERVVREHTPLDFDRRPLTDAVRDRALGALDAAPDSSFLRGQAAAVLSDVARLLRDDGLWERFSEERTALPADVHDSIFFPVEPTIEDVTDRRDRGELDATQAALLLAAAHETAGDSGLVVSTLQEALFSSSDREARAVVLRALVRFMRRAGQGDEAAPLIRDVPVPEADRWLLTAEGGDGPPDLAGAAQYPLDVPVLAFVAERLLADTPATPPEADRPVLPEDPERRASTWSARLVAALPSRSSRLLHAQALWREHDDGALLVASRDLGPADAVQAADFEAFALEGLGQLSEAADRLVAASAEHPEADRLATNAAAALLRLDRADEAERFLEPRVESGLAVPGVLVNYARALLVQHPADPPTASRAFDLLARAYDLDPRQDIAQEAWKAARGAGRGREAGRFFVAMTEGAATVQVETPDDVERALSQSGPSGFTRFAGSLDAFAEAHAAREEQDRERREWIDRLSTAHALAYVDTFRASGHPWENWTHWTLLAEDRDAKGFAVLADWPAGTLESARHAVETYTGAYADPTALLTLGVLGAERAGALLEAAAPVHVAADTIDGLRREGARLENDILVRGHSPAVGLVDRLADSPAVVTYDESVEQVAPDDPALGAARVDLGVAVLTGGRYVTDVDDLAGWGDTTRPLALSSATLLATLNAEGWVANDDADRLAATYPDTFAGWGDAEPLDAIPESLVFSPFAALDWEAAELLERLAERVRLGPWSWSFLARESQARRLAASAYERLRSTTAVIAAAVDAGHVVVVEPEPTPSPPDGLDPENQEGFEAMTDVWSRALQSLQTARARGLLLWADDRFYPLLLWVGGPTLQGAGTELLRSAFEQAARTFPPVSTVALADILVRLGRFDEASARQTAGTLFDLGYRPIHPLTLADAVERYTPRSEGPLRGRFGDLAAALEALPTYLPDSLGTERRMGFARGAAATLAGRMIAAAWSLPDLDDDQRGVLADGFVDAAERVFESQSPPPSAPRADRTRLLFWNAAITALQTLPATDDESVERRHRALRWLGRAAARRTGDRIDVTRLFEDHVLDTIRFVTGLDAPVDLPAEWVGRFALPGLVPLFESDLLGTLDPLLRRTLGRLGRLSRHGRIDTTYTIEPNGEPIPFTIPEERDELAALNLIRRVRAGDESLAPLIRAASLAFAYEHAPPDDWVEAGMPADEGVHQNVEVSLFTLLWAEAPDLHPVLLSALTLHLAVADPALAHGLRTFSDELLSDDGPVAEAARDRLALAILESVHFDLRRDLGHGMWRLRNGETPRLDGFVGWIGAEDAQALADLDPAVAARVHVIGDVIVPKTHFFARALLTDKFDDGPDVLRAVADASAENPTSNPPTFDVAVWLADRAATAETNDDPFVAAYALRHVLLALRASSRDLGIQQNGGEEPAVQWVCRYVLDALADDREPWHLISARRRLLRAALQLGAFACAGARHVEAYESEDDPLTEFLDRTWVLASRLVASLPGECGGIAEAVEAAERAVHDLGLDSDATRAVDRFDPFALSGPDDPGRVLTLAAVYKSLDPKGGAPSWWSEPIQARLHEIAKTPPSDRDPDPEDLADGLGIGVALRERVLAQAILDGLGVPDRT